MTLKNSLQGLFFAIAPALLSAACGAPDEASEPVAEAQEALAAGASQRPSSVPADYVITPNGYFHPSCVHELAQGESVQGSVISSANGRQRTVPKCGHLRFDRRGNITSEVKGAQPEPTPAPATTGWIISAQNNTQPPVKSLSTKFSVPQNPKVDGEQTLYFFPGIEPTATGNTIMQPVLAWYHGWTMQSWNCCYGDNTYHSVFVPVSAGNSLLGNVDGSSCDSYGVCANWQVKTTNLTNTEFTSLPASSYGQAMNWLFGGVLEVYSLTECGQLPPDNSISFSNITTTATTGANLTYPWSTAYDASFVQCGYSLSSSPTNVTLSWQTPVTLAPLARAGWTATASATSGTDVAGRTLDGISSTRWTTGVPQSNAATQWLKVDMKTPQTFSQVTIDSPGTDYARNYQVFVSTDGTNWGSAIATGSSSSSSTVVTFAQRTARYIQVKETTAAGVGSWWSVSELNVLGPASATVTALSRAGWTATGSATAEAPSNALDGNLSTRWSTSAAQVNGQYFLVDMQAARSFKQVTLDAGPSTGDYPRGYQIFVSNDGANWGSAVATGSGMSALVRVTFTTQTARYIKVVQTGSASSWWSLAELNVYN